MKKKQNIDPKEIEKFEKISDDWWNENGDFEPLHKINDLRAKFIADRSSLAGKKILDLGCGGGILSETLSNFGAKVIGIDASEKTIQIAQAHALKVNSKVMYMCTTAEELLESKKFREFDVITCLEMLEHVPKPSKIVETCSTLLKDEGDIYFSTINRNPRSYLFAVIGAEYILNLLPRGTHDYSKFIKPSELTGWLRSCGLSVKESIGISYNPLNDHYWLSKDLGVNYLLHVTKKKYE